MSRRSTIAIVVLAAVALAGLGALLGWGLTRDHDPDMMRIGGGMMAVSDSGGDPVRDMAEARERADRFADRLALKVGEVMRFSNGYYAELVEDGGALATEVLVNPRTGAVWLEPGPAMMWNTRYGMMGAGMMTGPGMMGATDGSGWMMGSGGMMGGGAGMMGTSGPADPTWTPWGTAVPSEELTPARARAVAARWLSASRSGLRPGAAEAFPGYYTLHTLRDGRIVGMLSVNAYTGAVCYHWWHGRFVATSD